ncbi:MAG: Flp family type IVb pilin [Burkholderiales bacterium]|nr:Flp family type IVb pilin [Burkholderiales bacterium]
MQKTLDLVRDFARDEEGVTAIEYGLLAALIAVAIIVAAGLVGTNLAAVFKYVAGKLTTP